MFGPVATVHTYATEAEALALANGTPFGLEGYVVGADTDARARLRAPGPRRRGQGQRLLDHEPAPDVTATGLGPRPAWARRARSRRSASSPAPASSASRAASPCTRAMSTRRRAAGAADRRPAWCTCPGSTTPCRRGWPLGPAPPRCTCPARPPQPSQLGVPDLGFVHGSDIARRAAAQSRPLAGLPVLADADTGYGNALQARAHHRGLRGRRRRRPAPRGPGRAQALRPPRRQGGRRPGRGDHPDPGRGRRRDGSGRRGPHRRAAGPRPRRGRSSAAGPSRTPAPTRCSSRVRTSRSCTGSARRCRGSRWSTAGPRPGDRSMPARPTPSSRPLGRAAGHPPGVRGCSRPHAPRPPSTPRSPAPGTPETSSGWRGRSSPTWSGCPASSSSSSGLRMKAAVHDERGSSSSAPARSG